MGRKHHQGEDTRLVPPKEKFKYPHSHLPWYSLKSEIPLTASANAPPHTRIQPQRHRSGSSITFRKYVVSRSTSRRVPAALRAVVSQALTLQSARKPLHSASRCHLPRALDAVTFVRGIPTAHPSDLPISRSPYPFTTPIPPRIAPTPPIAPHSTSHPSLFLPASRFSLRFALRRRFVPLASLPALCSASCFMHRFLLRFALFRTASRFAPCFPYRLLLLAEASHFAHRIPLPRCLITTLSTRYRANRYRAICYRTTYPLPAAVPGATCYRTTRYRATRYHAATLPRFHAIMPSCYYATALSRYHAIMLPRFRAASLPYSPIPPNHPLRGASGFPDGLHRFPSPTQTQRPSQARSRRRKTHRYPRQHHADTSSRKPRIRYRYRGHQEQSNGERRFPAGALPPIPQSFLVSTSNG